MHNSAAHKLRSYQSKNMYILEVKGYSVLLIFQHERLTLYKYNKFEYLRKTRGRLEGGQMGRGSGETRVRRRE